MRLDIYKLLDRGRELVTTIEVDESQSSIIERLNETDRLSLTITSEALHPLQVGCFTEYKGKSYYIVKEPTVRMIHTTLYHTELEMEAPAGLTRTVVFANPIDKRTTFDYTATPREHLQLIIDSLNAKFFTNDLRWSLGGVHCESKTKHIKYDHETVWEALQTLRETYQTDLYCDGTALSLGKSASKEGALRLAYGSGKGLLSGLERLQRNDRPAPKCLYVTGGKRNLAKGTLTLQPSQYLKVLDNGTITRSVSDITAPNVYVTDPEGRYIYDYSAIGEGLVAEDTYTNEEIYPSRVGTATSVVKVRDHYEVANDSTINYRDYLIAGETMQIVFQTGELAGRAFDAKYNHGTKRFAIVPTEEGDTTLPNDTLKPKQGDKYIVTGIALPGRYIEEAQKALTDEAVKHLHKLKVTQYSYKAEIDPVFLTNDHDSIAPLLTVGSYVRIDDPTIAPGDPEVRIIGKRTYLDRPLQPEIELSNEVEPPREPTTQDLISSILGDNIVSLTDKLRGEVEESQVTISDDLKKQLEEGLRGKVDKTTAEEQQQATNKTIAELSKNLAGKVDIEGLSTSIESKLQDPATIALYKGRDGANGKDGHSPIVEVRPDKYIYIDGVKQQYLKGDTGAKGATGAKGDTGAKGADGKSVTLADLAVQWQGDKLSVAGKLSPSLRGGKGDKGDKPTAQEILADSNFSTAVEQSFAGSEAWRHLTTEVQGKANSSALNNYLPAKAFTEEMQVRDKELADTHNLAEYGATLADLNKADLKNKADRLQTNQAISNALGETEEVRKVLTEVNSETQNRIITLSNALDTLPYVARPELGDMQLRSGQVDFQGASDKTPYLTIGRGAGEHISQVVASNVTDRYAINGISFRVSGSYERTVAIDNDQTRLTVSFDIRTDSQAGVELYIAGQSVATYKGTSEIIEAGLNGKVKFVPIAVAHTGESFVRIVPKGRTIIRFRSTDGTTQVSNFKVHLYHSTAFTQSLITPQGARFYGSAERYLDIDYRDQYLTRYPVFNPNGGVSYLYRNARNPYTLQVKGGAKIDEIDAPGVALCGATFDAGGTQVRAFGKYKDTQGSSNARAEWDYTMEAYRVYHSIGHTNYIPIVQVSSWTSNNINWSLTPRVYGVNPYYFDVRLLTNGDNSRREGFSYVAYKTM